MKQEDLISTVNKGIAMNNNRAVEISPFQMGKWLLITFFIRALITNDITLVSKSFL